MKELLRIFQYIQKYHEDNFDVLRLSLEFLLVAQNQALVAEILEYKKREIPPSFYEELQKYDLSSQILINPKLNYKKVFKIAQNLKINAQELEDFIQTIALQKTILKLYDYATPAEINALVCGLLHLQKNESIYNPCCGMGSWLLSLSAHHKECRFFGVDIHPKLIGIAKVLAALLGFKNCYLEVADIFKESAKFKEISNPQKQSKNSSNKFDKIFCHPPLLTHLNLKAPKDSPLAPYTKTAPEIPFLDFALCNFEKKAIFIIRSVLLNKPIGERLRQYLIESGLIEAIIELPTNIFPHQMGEFCLLVLSPNNKRVFFMDAQSFYLKEGKYNKLIKQEEILDLFALKQNSDITCLRDYQALDLENLKPSYYMQFQNSNHSKQTAVLLGQFIEKCYRGVRIETQQDKDLLGCYDLGIKDFANYGFSNAFDDYVLKPNLKRLHELKVQPYDLLLSMRGVAPKVAIIGSNAAQKIVLPNAGILVLRVKDSRIARALYFYFLSFEGHSMLSKIYQSNNERVGEKELKEMPLPNWFLDSQILEEYQEHFYELIARGEQIQAQKRGIAKLLGYKNPLG
ncbi:N-6 DNA methylase [Helicobacter sp. MIT 05-5294]|uniref:N-6 DNA methylase n=1 Tax=Helicobacter sp. MIT 05-5294 TaxID=1548150 RepID=UPI0010FDDCC0|nr:N-6 DNA methylase [Helicobacter sp. MIT 05-5294]TLD86721.1 SAM-dependent DNA methyltransferase [Helicobacter sp. MIT 05-5294]